MAKKRQNNDKKHEKERREPLTEKQEKVKPWPKPKEKPKEKKGYSVGEGSIVVIHNSNVQGPLPNSLSLFEEQIYLNSEDPKEPNAAEENRNENSLSRPTGNIPLNEGCDTECQQSGCKDEYPNEHVDESRSETGEATCKRKIIHRWETRLSNTKEMEMQIWSYKIKPALAISVNANGESYLLK